MRRARPRVSENKFLDELYGPDKDTRFFMGTRHPFKHLDGSRCFLAPKGMVSRGCFEFRSTSRKVVGFYQQRSEKILRRLMRLTIPQRRAPLCQRP